MRDRKDNKMIWKHIEEELQKKIFIGAIEEDMKFPSYAEISNQYNIDRNTALKICKSLESKNIIYRKIGLGFFLMPSAVQKTKDLYINKLNEKTMQIINDARLIGMTNTEIKDLFNRLLN